MIKIIGCGNILRRDDGIGVYVIEELEKMSLSKNVELIDAGTRGLDMVSFLEGAQKVVIIDAVKNHGKPGTIYRFDVDEKEEIETYQPEFVSTHEFNWEDTLVIGRKILGAQFPKKVTFFGIEIENVETGLGLSPALKESLYKVVNVIQKELEEGYNVVHRIQKELDDEELSQKKEAYTNDKTKLLGV